MLRGCDPVKRAAGGVLGCTQPHHCGTEFGPTLNKTADNKMWTLNLAATVLIWLS